MQGYKTEKCLDETLKTSVFPLLIRLCFGYRGDEYAKMVFEKVSKKSNFWARDTFFATQAPRGSGRPISRRPVGSSTLQMAGLQYDETTRADLIGMANRPIVVAYFEQVGYGNKLDEITLWKESWGRCGFTPVLRTRTHAAKHPHFKQFIDRIRHYPTRNLKAYEDACYLRWLAFESAFEEYGVEWAVASDTDVFNYWATPETFPRYGSFWIHDRGSVPCLVSSNRAGAHSILEVLLSADQGYPEYREADGRVHMSDMRVLQEYNKRTNWAFMGKPLSFQFGDGGDTGRDYSASDSDSTVRFFTNWVDSPCVHFSAGSIPQGHSKVSAAVQFRKP